MNDPTSYGVFLSAAVVLAITPGPGIFYVMTRSIKGGRAEGLASAMGTFVGDLFHVVAAALGVSVILAASAIAFNLVKYLGAAYLVYLGVQTVLSHGTFVSDRTTASRGYRKAFLQGITVEVLNPKTALFFLAFIPHFINPERTIFTQFLLLGITSVILNTIVDLIVISLAGLIYKQLQTSPKMSGTQRFLTGTGLIALGSYVAFASGGESYPVSTQILIDR